VSGAPVGLVMLRGAEARLAAVNGPGARGLHSFTFQLNLSAFCGIEGARRACVAHVKGVFGGMKGVKGVFVF